MSYEIVKDLKLYDIQDSNYIAMLGKWDNSNVFPRDFTTTKIYIWKNSLENVLNELYHEIDNGFMEIKVPLQRKDKIKKAIKECVESVSWEDLWKVIKRFHISCNGIPEKYTKYAEIKEFLPGHKIAYFDDLRVFIQMITEDNLNFFYSKLASIKKGVKYHYNKLLNRIICPLKDVFNIINSIKTDNFTDICFIKAINGQIGVYKSGYIFKKDDNKYLLTRNQSSVSGYNLNDIIKYDGQKLVEIVY